MKGKISFFYMIMEKDFLRWLPLEASRGTKIDTLKYLRALAKAKRLVVVAGIGMIY